jgi:hypothetical protein
MDFIKNDQPVLILLQEQGRVGEFVPVVPGLQIEIEGGASFGDFQRQRRLADLTRPDQCDRRLAVELSFPKMRTA